VPFERARVRLSYGQWLRRERRHKDARPHLNAAAHVFRLLAATPWLAAAAHEQRAAGVRSGAAPADALSSLSPTERQVVLLAAEGLTNPEIAARLFVSPRTVGAHLYRSFAKLGVSNRTQLTALAR
jgi:DNA-binding CsgD family transcriptional regulator